MKARYPNHTKEHPSPVIIEGGHHALIDQATFQKIITLANQNRPKENKNKEFILKKTNCYVIKI